MVAADLRLVGSLGLKVGSLVLTMIAPAMALAPWEVVCGPRNTSMLSTSQTEVAPKNISL